MAHSPRWRCLTLSLVWTLCFGFERANNCAFDLYCSTLALQILHTESQFKSNVLELVPF
jgi:hypothetical protein